MLTLGSLFDGIGGFPLAAQRVGIKPVWASEIEKFPIQVTKEHFPEMIHMGDITKLNGAELPPVDIITGGSPCQDLSVAQGRRDGLAGSRSGLFYEMVRVVKEMRDAEKRRGRAAQSVRPRWICWENVPGSFSSGEPPGEDFRIVLQEFTSIGCGAVPIPRPATGRWSPVGTVQRRPSRQARRGNLLGEFYWETLSPWLGGALTHNTGVSPREGRASFLWQILQAQAPPKYYLSKKACLGILRRSKERGKPLPPQLELALKIQGGLLSAEELPKPPLAFHINQREEVIDLGETARALMATIYGVPAQARRSGLRGERRSSGMNELSPLGGSERCGACDDAQTFVSQAQPFAAGFCAGAGASANGIGIFRGSGPHPQGQPERQHDAIGFVPQ